MGRTYLKIIMTLGTTVIYTVVIGVVTMITALFSKSGRLPFLFCRLWAYLMLKTNGVALCVEGLEHLRKDDSYIYISNHASLLDPPAVAVALPHPLRFVAKKSLARIPVFGWATRLARMIFIDRANTPEALAELNKTVCQLNDGICAYFFAEGTRSRDGMLMPFKKGGFMLAINAGIPVVPVTIINTYALLPKNGLYIQKGTVTVHISPPIDTSHMTPEDCEALLHRTRADIAYHLGQSVQPCPTDDSRISRSPMAKA